MMTEASSVRPPAPAPAEPARPPLAAGGTNVGNAGGAVAEAVPQHGHVSSLLLPIPPLAALVFRAEGLG